MNLKINNEYLRLATRDDKSIVKKILVESFKNDPCIQWLTEQSSNKNKLNIIMDYIIDETFVNGFIYLTSDNLGVVLWKNEQKEKITYNFIKRNLVFLFKMGVSSVIRNLKNMADTNKHFPKNQPFYYLYSIGVLPEAQGKGIASKLMNPVIELCNTLKLPIFLETANNQNIKIYQKKGFNITDTKSHGSKTLFYMRYSLL